MNGICECKPGVSVKADNPLSPKDQHCLDLCKINDRYVSAVNDKFRVAQLVFQAVLTL